jgi:uncharacterized protein (TIGR03790 family)
MNVIGSGFLLLCVFFATSAGAATADEVLVVVNKRMSGAKDIARYYMKARGIPKRNLLVTSLSLEELMERDEYENRLRKPVVKKIASLQRESNIYAIVLIYGVPLKVQPPVLDWDVQEQLQELKKEQSKLRSQSEKTALNSPRLKEIGSLIANITGQDKRAAVDSELMLAKVEDYSLSGWIENPYFVGFKKKASTLRKDDVLLVSRLDGPDEKTVYRIINDTIKAEEEGLEGVAYFDARWKLPEKKDLSGYALWDASLHRAATVVSRRMKVQLNEEAALFGPGAAPQAALYSGWYSLAQYVDSFDWVQGSVGYHIASSECSTLRKSDSQVWCLQMLKHGVAATIGPVYEPYVQGFPMPEIFFAALTEGYMNLGESYLISLPFISWQMVLVGDPLYKPFKPVLVTEKKGSHQ